MTDFNNQKRKLYPFIAYNYKTYSKNMDSDKHT